LYVETSLTSLKNKTATRFIHPVAIKNRLKTTPSLKAWLVWPRIKTATGHKRTRGRKKLKPKLSHPPAGALV
jgi:hypothetical protein